MSTLFSHFFEKINQITPLEAKYTEVLGTIAVMPKMLYYYGKIPQKRTKTVAIVGSRHNTRYGEEVAYQLGYTLAKHGVIVISGLAYGIDSIGHQAALDADGTTIAVLGTPINEIYPRNHRKLTKVYPITSFLERNRIISGLSDIVVVVEAAERSGSLNTATHALEQGKEVFAVPGNITNPYSQGCNKLIRQGAFPYTEPDDILRELFPEEFLARKKKCHLKGDTDVETLILNSLAGGLRSGEEIMTSTKLPPEVFNQSVTLLEIKGRIRALGANAWALN